ncbi:MAG: hypothetical protein COB76_05315 [Alphaproteobacteria bacterium]|nr:MAG: hypothetical protein COB76_05315 [Alphaproteobacteria bacterium]
MSYWTAWLKANYPVEFMTASMSLDKGNTDKLAIFKQDCNNLEIEILRPDVNKSEPDFAVEDGAVRYALSALKGVGEAAMETVVCERNANGAFKDVFDFAERVDPKALNKRQVQGLASAGGFESLGVNRASMHGSAETILRYAQTIKADRESGQTGLFGGADMVEQNRPPLADVPEWPQLEKLAFEFKAVGFYLSAHPLDPRMKMLERLGVTPLGKIEMLMQDCVAMRPKIAGVLIGKQERIAKSGNKFAFLQISDPTGVMEVMIFSELLATARDMLVTGTNLLIDLDVQQKDDQVRVNGTNISLLDEAIKDKTRQTYIELINTQSIDQVKEILTTDGEGKAFVTFTVPINDNKYADIRLSKQYNLCPETMTAIQNLDGVESVRDV